MTRIYIVHSEADGPQLVKAKSRAQAVAAVVRNRYQVEPADAVTVAEMVGGGAKVLDAAAQEAPDCAPAAP